MRQTNRKAILLLSTTVLLLAAACEAEDPPETAEEPPDGDAGEVQEVSFAASSMPSSIGLVAAIIREEELDTAHGLDLEFREFAPDAAEQALLTGQVDTGFFPVVSLGEVRAQGQDVIFLRPLQANHGEVIVRDEDPYESLEDLQGETIGTLAPVSGLYTSMQVLSAELGLDWEEDFEVISGPPPGLVSFIETGEVEAIVHFEPNVSRLLGTGDFRSVMVPTEEWEELTGHPLFMLGLATREEWAEANPEAAQSLVSVFDDLFALIDEDPDLLRQFQDELDLDDEAMDIATERMPGIYIREGPEEVEENVRVILERSVELGILEEVPDDVFWDFDG